MPPKKDAKKGGAAKEVDPALFVRKVSMNPVTCCKFVLGPVWP